MNNKLSKILDYMMTRSETKKGLYAIQKMFLVGIPFNKPHGLKFLKIGRNDSHFKLANKRANHNHLGGMHAIAQCLLGEFSAGILLIKNFSGQQYRIIMKDISAVYLKQAKCEIHGKAHISDEEIENLKAKIAQEDKADIKLTTLISNPEGEKVAEVTTTWQLKDWSKTSFKG